MAAGNPFRPEVDLVVVGAGPAGSIAAFEAARAGVSVLIIDRFGGGGAKPCAGGLTTKALNLLPFSIAGILEDVTGTVNVGLRFAEPVRLTTAGFVCAFAVRRNLDRLLLEAALDAGAVLETAGDIRSIDVEAEGGVRLRLGDGHAVDARFLIAADGANSLVRRLVQPKGLTFSRGFAVEGTVALDSLGSRPEMEFDFGVVPHGYGWIFPKRNHVNLGLYTAREDVSLSKAAVRDYAVRKLGVRDVEGIVGYPLGFGGQTYRQGGGRILFAGDAGGFCEPLLGEGLHNAFKTGRAAGRAVATAVASGGLVGATYDASIADVRRDLARSAWLANRFFYPNLDTMCMALLSFSWPQRALMRGFAAARTLKDIIDAPLTTPFRRPVLPESLVPFASRGETL